MSGGTNVPNKLLTGKWLCQQEPAIISKQIWVRSVFPQEMR